MAYIGYDTRLRTAPSRTRPARFKMAWGRLAVTAASGLAWIGIIAAIRAIF